MQRSDYEAYLSHFNRRDYQGVLGFWAPAFEARFAQVILRNGAELLRFYRFFHHYATEKIDLLDFVSDERLVALRAVVRVEGVRQLSQETLNDAGYGSLHPVEAGEVLEIPQLIMYRVESGRFTEVWCAVV